MSFYLFFTKKETNRFPKTSRNVQGGIMRPPSDGGLKINVPLVLISTEEKKIKQQFVTILLLQMYYFSNFRALCHVICIKYTYFPSSLFLPCLLSNGILSYTPAKLDLDVMSQCSKNGKNNVIILL